MDTISKLACRGLLLIPLLALPALASAADVVTDWNLKAGEIVAAFFGATLDRMRAYLARTLLRTVLTPDDVDADITGDAGVDFAAEDADFLESRLNTRSRSSSTAPTFGRAESGDGGPALGGARQVSIMGDPRRSLTP